MTRRAGAVIALCLAAAAPMARATPARAAPSGPVFVIGLEAHEFRRLLPSRSGPVGLGAFPASRDPLRFMEEVSLGAPLRTAGERSPLGGAEGNLTRALLDAGVSVGVAGDGPARIVEGLRRALRLPADPVVPATGPAVGTQVLGVALDTAEDAVRFVSAAEGTQIFVGFGERTPLLLALCREDCARGGPHGGPPRAVLDGGIARRPGIATPYDVAATILDLAGVARPAKGFIGKALTSREDRGAAATVDRLARRLERDASYAPALAAAGVSLAGAGVAVAVALGIAGLGTIALRVAQGSALVILGYVGAMFIPSASSLVRSSALVAAFLLGAALPARDPPRTIGRLLLAGAGVLALLAVVAPLRPGGEPGLSIWGDPLVSWRFFGLQNFEAGFIAAGVVVGGTLAGLSARALVVASVVAAVVIGAPRIGANFVGVLTFMLGASLAVSALVRRRAEAWQLLGAAGVAVVSFGLALLADAGSPVSHGGQAVEHVRQGGIGRALEFVRIRLRLNLDLIRDFPGGFVWLGALVLIAIALFWWGRRLDRPPLAGRAAVGAGAAMGAAAYALEDSGFYIGTELVFYAAAAWALVKLSEIEPVSPASSDVRAVCE